MQDTLTHLLQHPDPAATARACFEFLNRVWRDEAGTRRLVDPATGLHLPRFEAGGRDWHILTPDDHLPLVRAQNLRVRLVMVGHDAGLESQMAQLEQARQALNRAQPDYVAAAAVIHSMQMAITKATRVFPFPAEAACLFIVEEGEDLTKLPTDAQMHGKMECWNDAGIHPMDFFFLCMNWATGWNESMRGYLQRLSNAPA
jgi:hypothetical protein